MSLSPSELILNPDGSIYHLNLLPEDIAQTIITVGDPDRVDQVSKHFDSVETRKGKREFHAHTGHLNGKRLTVLSTGIGTDNIDIVLNELDALMNIDFATRTIKPVPIALDIVRIGTSGALQGAIPVDSFLLSELAMGFDGLMHFYAHEGIDRPEIAEAFVQQTRWSPKKAYPYVIEADPQLVSKLHSNRIRLGLTITNTGFYGPQSRSLRLPLPDEDLPSKIAAFRYQNNCITNLEMETSGIYLLAKLLGHRAVSMNCILANRSNGTFSKNPEIAVDNLIRYVLERLTQ